MSLSNGQFNLIAQFVEAGLTTFDEAETAFRNSDARRISNWRKRLTRLSSRVVKSEATSFYDRQGIAQRKA